ncbi:MAG: hypothetical protein DWQ34_19660 [Planctomycetota bacterium]|nr:MAG: hypothetical protein DWQ29_11330 [Planctomycetota bacterium]REJ89474.1 MAG: hypothetical protein DWQ34_19660 [Planctomycetota bacterium]REK28955.1 MAG: hypothetical protein DWQ41_05260 [Planctomycetota bacterium]REK39611.1 MAG: hypothetical protein DWQ45_01685 [Planctomycetota bacterium]
MANHSFRAACWALCIAVALSTCMLLTDPEQARSILLSRQALPPVDVTPRASLTEPPVQTLEMPGSRVAFGAVEPLPSAPDPEPLPDPAPPQLDGDLQAADVAGWPEPDLKPTLAESPTVPVVTTTHRRPEEALFDELPPPPEFTADVPQDEPPPIDPAFIEFVEQFSELNTRIEGLRSDVSSLKESQTTVVRSLEQLAAEDATRRIPREVEIRTWVASVGLQGEATSGVVTAMLNWQSLATATAGPSSRGAFQCAWVDEPPERILRWLNQVTASREMTMRTLRLSPTSTARLDLMQPLAPRMEQARGRQIIERLPIAAADHLEIRAFEVQPGFVEVEFAVRGSHDSGDWNHVAVPSDGVLVLTIPVARSQNEFAAQVDRERTPSNRRGRSREILVVLSPRLIEGAAGNTSIPVYDDPPPATDSGPRLDLFEIDSP